MPSIDALVNALRQYQGTLVFVSHDVHFIRTLATSVLHVHAGHLTPYAGDYEYYLEKSQAVGEREALVAKLHNHQPTFEKVVETPAAPVSAPTPGLGLKEIREQRRAESEANKAAAKARASRKPSSPSWRPRWSRWRNSKGAHRSAGGSLALRPALESPRDQPQTCRNHRRPRSRQRSLDGRRRGAGRGLTPGRRSATRRVSRTGGSLSAGRV